MPVGDASAAFRSKADAYAAEIAATQAATPGHAGESMIRKKVRWQTRGKKYLAGRKVAFDPAQLVRPSPDLQATILRQLDLVYPATVGAMERHLVQLAENTFQKWPVYTGLSKSLIDLSWSAGEKDLRGSVACFAPYTAFIQKGVPMRQLWKDGTEAGRRIAADIAQGVSR